MEKIIVMESAIPKYHRKISSVQIILLLINILRQHKEIDWAPKYEFLFTTFLNHIKVVLPIIKT